jgi:hypothetical protein
MNSTLRNGIAALILSACAQGVTYAQTDATPTAESDPDTLAKNVPPGNPPPSSSLSPTQPPKSAPSTSSVGSSLFYFLNMSGKSQSDFAPLTARQKFHFYAKGLFGPFMFATAAASAGLAQVQDVPSGWGQGAEGYGQRFGNYYGKQAVQRTLRLAGEVALREDNRYFTSGEHGLGRRIVYALESSVMARKNDGTRHISISEVGSIAGASFISRLWQPSTNNSAGDGAVSFGVGMGLNAGINVVREFLPDVAHHFFGSNRQQTPTVKSVP